MACHVVIVARERETCESLDVWLFCPIFQAHNCGSHLRVPPGCLRDVVENITKIAL